MKLTVEKEAVQWFREEMGAREGDAIRFFVRMGGCSTVQSGFSLGITKEPPIDAGLSIVEDGITFYIEKEDLWYLGESNLVVTYNKSKDEIDFAHE
ncbi:HesB/YadR/YfhF family protein [Aneurinibacillus tyrosinisolvens]|uniref:HesB/YadR/YfhF family protein n=1 Tax=Aneurinibacillus tyrosinisolvens TaxID=1443435 RepID=UPI00063FC9E2|nr:HesB/YadR/YfhF family protein [Aneurinibacillus tyrosinisolvens]